MGIEGKREMLAERMKTSRVQKEVHLVYGADTPQVYFYYGLIFVTGVGSIRWHCQCVIQHMHATQLGGP